MPFDITKEPLIIQAAARGDLPAVMSMVAQDIDEVHVKASNGSQALAFAAEEGHEAVCDYLLQSGADPHVLNNESLSAFHFALAFNHIAIAKKILKQVSKPNKTPLPPHVDDHYQPTPLLLLAKEVMIQARKQLFMGSSNLLSDYSNTNGWNNIVLCYSRYSYYWKKNANPASGEKKHTLQFDKSAPRDFLLQGGSNNAGPVSLSSIAALNASSYFNPAGCCGELSFLTAHFIMQKKIEGLKIFILNIAWPSNENSHSLIAIQDEYETIYIDSWGRVCFSNRDKDGML